MYIYIYISYVCTYVYIYTCIYIVKSDLKIKVRLLHELQRRVY